jgi:hypothetical protein
MKHPRIYQFPGFRFLAPLDSAELPLLASCGPRRFSLP